MNHMAFRIAASTLVVGATMVGCKPAAELARPAMLSKAERLAERDAVKQNDQALAAAVKKDFAGAVVFAEKAVELSPRDLAYRMTLADLYLKNGRYQSAQTAYGDVLTLQPGNERASLSMSLIEIALGNSGAAIERLDGLAGTASPSDVGLAYALAGQTDRAITLLEPAARTEGADARTRQNLALAYAFAGDWRKARITAAQDISPAEIDRRMEAWAQLARPAEAHSQVAMLLGVQPVADPGQPVRLALAPAAPEIIVDQAPPEAFAAAAPIPDEPAIEPAVEPISYALAPVETPSVEPVIAEPAPAPVQFASVVVPAESLPSTVDAFKAPRVVGGNGANAKPRPRKAAGSPSPYVVQIGAYTMPTSVERAWTAAQRRFGLGEEMTPLSNTVMIPGRGRFHRLALSGFASRGEAADLCVSIRRKGGACFVRRNSGDEPVRWASNKSPARG